MKDQTIALLPIIEQIARIGCYETDMTTGTWTGTNNFISLFGLEKKPVYTVQEFQALVHPDDFEWVMAHFADCLRKKIDFDCEYRCIGKEGETIYVNSRSKVYYREDGTPEKVLGVKQDITLSKMNELRLSQLNENNSKKNEVLSLVAHDLKSPLAQMEALADLMRLQLDAKFHDLILLQQSICKSAQGILSEIVEIAELEDEEYKLKTSLTDINGIIEESVNAFQHNAQEKGITLQTRFTNECCAWVNHEKFARMIRNLLSNAIKFSDEGTTVDLGSSSNDDKMMIAIRDHGIGIKPEHLPLLFEKFSKTIRRPGTRGEQSTGTSLRK